MNDLLLTADVLLGECKGTLQVDQHDGHRRIANKIDKLRARIQQRLDTGGWIPVAEGKFVSAFNIVYPGDEVYTRDSKGNGYSFTLPALPKEK